MERTNAEASPPEVVERVVLDASALAALLFGERGADVVEAYLPHALVNAVNVAEVLAVLGRRGLDHGRAVRLVESLPLRIVSCDWSVAHNAARIHALARDAGLSLGDCICLATGFLQSRKVLTADHAWRQVDCGVTLELIR